MVIKSHDVKAALKTIHDAATTENGTVARHNEGLHIKTTPIARRQAMSTSTGSKSI